MLGVVSISCEAGSLDKYRDILASRHYTFKCLTRENSDLMKKVPFEEREKMYSMAGKVQVSEEQARRDMAKFETQYDMGRFYDVIAMDGDNRFITTQQRCKLIKDGKVYTFFYNPGTGKYYGANMRKKIVEGQNYWPDGGVAMGDKDRSFKSREEIDDIGNPLLMKTLAVIYPVSRANVELPEYSYAASGQSKDGLAYDDYAGESGGRKHVVRCYFKGEDLVQMAYVSYPLEGERSKKNMDKYTLEIKEFSAVPEAKYFTLPSELKVSEK